MRTLLILLLSTVVACAAMVTIRWTPNTNLTVNGLPAQYIKISYGSQYKVYTNSVVSALTNLNTTNYYGYDAFNCEYVNVKDCVLIPIQGLTLNQPFYYAYSLINSNGEERVINDTACAWIVTNRMSLIIPPYNLRALGL